MIRTPASDRLSLSIFAFLIVFVVVAFLQTVLSDGDTWWHLAAGEWIANENKIPHSDPFSHSRPGAPWHAHEWGAELLMWGTFRLGGWGALIALAAAMAGSAATILCYFIQRYMSPVAATMMTTGAVMCLLPSILVRPHLLVLPLFVGWVAMLLWARDKERAPPLALAFVMIVWANLHASFLIGLALVGPFALEALIAAENKPAAFRQWFLFGFLALLGSLVTPFGLNGFLYPLQVSSMTTLHAIGEWVPTSFRNSRLFLAVLLASFFAFLTLGVRFSPIRALLFLCLLLMALIHIRHQFLFGFIGALIAAEPVGRALLHRKHEGSENPALDRRVLIGMIVLCVAAMTARLFLPVDLDRQHQQPLAAIASVPAELRNRPVFNYYDFGGPIIYSGIKPFIDGRADMYGDDFFKEYLAAEKGDLAAWRRVSARYDIGWTILPPGSPLVLQLKKDGWRQIHADKRAVIHVRPRAREKA